MPSETEKPIELAPRRRGYLPLGSILGLALAIVAIVLVAILSIRSVRNDNENGERVTHAMAVLDSMETLLSRVKDAETSQRGYLLTGKDSYLAPLNNARADLPGLVEGVRQLVADSPDQTERIGRIDGLIKQKLTELQQTVELHQVGKADEALSIVLSDRGKNVMDQIRTQVAAMTAAERTSLAARQEEWKGSATSTADVVMIGLGVVLILLLFGGVMLSREYQRQSSEAWSETGLGCARQPAARRSAPGCAGPQRAGFSRRLSRRGGRRDLHHRCRRRVSPHRGVRDERRTRTIPSARKSARTSGGQSPSAAHYSGAGRLYRRELRHRTGQTQRTRDRAGRRA